MGHHKGAFVIEGEQAIQVSEEQGSWIFFRPHGYHQYVIVVLIRDLFCSEKKTEG